MTPRRVPRPCAFYGCPAVVLSGTYCRQHERERKQQVDARRRKGADRGFYSSPAWKTLAGVVRVEEPDCRLCGRPTEVVDHIEPRRDRPDLALARANLRGLCKQCHDRRTASRGGGFGNPRKETP